LTTVRFHLHYVNERAEERISFEVQKTLSERLGYADRAGLSGVGKIIAI